MIDKPPCHSKADYTAGRPTTHLSTRRLAAWLRCPLACRFRYIDRVVTPPGPGLALGKLVRRGLELFYRHRQYEITLSAVEVIQWLRDCHEQLVAEESLVFASTAEEKSVREQAESLLAAYLEWLSRQEPVPLAVAAELHAPVIDHERGEDLGVVLVGFVDLVLAGQDGPVVVGFKTPARRQPPSEVAQQIELAANAYLVRQFLSDDEAALETRWLVKTKQPQIDVHRYGPRTPRHFGRLVSVIRAYLDDLANRRLVIRPHTGCGWCEYRDTHCASWQG